MSKTKIDNSVSSSPSECVYVFFTWNIQDLEGKILTQIDASTPDPVQRKASKDIFREMIWTWASGNNRQSDFEIYRDDTKGSTR